MKLKCLKILLSFCKNQSGATAIEYGLIAGIISTALIVGIKGTNNNGVDQLSKRRFMCVRGTLKIGGKRAQNLGSCKDLREKHFN